MNWVKPQGAFRVLNCLFMTGKELFATASNIVPGWTTKCFPKALNAYANDTKKNLNNLSAYSKKLRVYKK